MNIFLLSSLSVLKCMAYSMEINLFICSLSPLVNHFYSVQVKVPHVLY
jgi:hypothetical protein